MTVSELIDALQKIENKDLEVSVELANNGEGAFNTVKHKKSENYEVILLSFDLGNLHPMCHKYLPKQGLRS